MEELVRTYWPEAHRIALGIVADAAGAEDVAQESLLAAVRALDSFDRRRPFRPWMHRIVVNRSLDWVRGRQRQAEVELTPADLAVVSNGAPGAAGVPEPLLGALRALEPQARAIVVLRHVLDMDAREIGEMLEIPHGTVRSTLSRALARLRVRLEEVADRD